MPTGKEMCQTIVRALKQSNPDCKISPKDIWELSPTGELDFIFPMYIEAKDQLGELTEKDKENEMVSLYLQFKKAKEKKKKRLHSTVVVEVHWDCAGGS